MKENMTKADVTPEVKAGVAELLACMTIANVTREKVDEVLRDILTRNIALYDDLAAEHSRRAPERIYDPDRAYLSQDEQALQSYYTITDTALRAKGLKPDDMERDYCPALVAEHNQLKAEWSLLGAAATMLDLEFDGQELNGRLSGLGLGKRQEFLDLLIGLVVSL